MQQSQENQFTFIPGNYKGYPIPNEIDTNTKRRNETSTKLLSLQIKDNSSIVELENKSGSMKDNYSDENYWERGELFLQYGWLTPRV